MFSTVLIANRGEIAGRVARTLRRMGIAAAGVASDADRFSPVMRGMDHLVRLGPGRAAETYLNMDAIVAAARQTGAEAVHPGYGFLSENIAFAERLAAEGIRFIGPRPEHIRAFGLKHTARELAKAAGVPLLPGSDILKDVPQAKAQASRIGYPVMLKSTAGGGGIGMHLCHTEEELAQRFESVSRLACGNFGDARLYLERFVSKARHVEVQVFGDGAGKVVALGTRDCSLQRRNQKVIEEGPAPNLSDAVRTGLEQAAIALCRSVSYESAGTVEFVFDAERQEPYFLEVNTRLQVEHPVTEEIFGVDLVEWMVRQASGGFVLPPPDSLTSRGYAMEARLYAENPARDFRPSTGTITALEFPKGIRLESWIERGAEISPFYDPMLAKIVVHGSTRDDARAKLEAALKASQIWGIETNLDYLAQIAALPAFVAGAALTETLKDFHYRPRSVEVLAPGAQTSLQDWPGRLGYWNVGIPPSGPMDSRSHHLVNGILGNAEDAATLECTLQGPRLRFLCDTMIALGGADMGATLDGAPVGLWQAVPVKAGQVLGLGRVQGAGLRCYLAVAGGFDAPLYLGARATFSLGGFGGHATGVLKAGDTLRLSAAKPGKPTAATDMPELTSHWDIGVIYGPHGAPDFFTRQDIAALFESDYEVHFNSARTGVRLIGPKPQWARPDGGEAGLHPSNIHDNAYAIGAIDFTGDMPIILGPDGPSLGGFVCPAVIAADELWKLGQLKPGDKVRFRLRGGPQIRRPLPDSDILKAAGQAVYRRQGDGNLLVEYGPPTLDLTSRLRAHLLMRALEREAPRGLLDLTPGIRSLQVHHDPTLLPLPKLMDLLGELETGLPDPRSVTVPSREIWLPLSWNDEQAVLAMRKYQELVRPDAPWCPSNIAFIRRINGLNNEDDVRRIIFEASYLVMGLGDVYLGAPVATPLDPRHRLVTTKYNPARTWTPENAVGIGGAYLCVYGMEGPGGYQLFGRTIQMWNRWKATKEFDKPWLLRFFDRIRFFPVSGAELAEAREAFPHGAYPLRIEEGEFSLAAQDEFLSRHAESIALFKARQQAAFQAERQRWHEQGLDRFVSEEAAAAPDDDVPAGFAPVHSATMGTVWKLEVQPGEKVREGQTLLVIETMKMESEIVAPASGVLKEWRCQPGRVVQAGQVVALIAEAV
ncbi:MAG TPA: 5-oxoprolinase/urea amidolyase family protein [Rhizomicrobium sp.]|nr:5-oxoprolinase/urea amidolyase family protein [Rhizomicrobium sp.]